MLSSGLSFSKTAWISLLSCLLFVKYYSFWLLQNNLWFVKKYLKKIKLKVYKWFAKIKIYYSMDDQENISLNRKLWINPDLNPYLELVVAATSKRSLLFTQNNWKLSPKRALGCNERTKIFMIKSYIYLNRIKTSEWFS